VIISVARTGAALLTAALTAAWSAGPARPADASSTVPAKGVPQALATLTISETARADLGSVTEGTPSISGALGAVTVAAAGTGSWIASVSSTDFSNGGSTIPAADINYSTLVATTEGDVTLSPPRSGVLSGSASLTVQQASAVTGATTVTWNRRSP
jgi:hypothetical protein